MAPKPGHVHPLESGIELARPVPPLAVAQRQQRLLEDAHGIETAAQLGGRCGVQPQRMALETVAHDQIHLTQGQCGYTAHFVGPLHPAVADDKFRLREKPVGSAAIALARAREIQTGHSDLAAWRAPDVELGLLNIKLLKLQPQSRLRRQGRQHARQAQRFAPKRVKQLDVDQLERRNQPA